MNPVPVHREIESLIFYDHISLMGKVCEHQFFSLNPIIEPISTLTFESQLDLSQILELVFVPAPFEPKIIIFHNHTSLVDKGVEQNDLKIIFES